MISKPGKGIVKTGGGAGNKQVKGVMSVIFPPKGKPILTFGKVRFRGAGVGLRVGAKLKAKKKPPNKTFFTCKIIG